MKFATGTDGARSALEWIVDNPFYVLGLGPGATRQEVEREGQKLLGMLELGLKSAAEYETPVGRRGRTADKIRRAMAELRDPERRLVHELWARLRPGTVRGVDPQDEEKSAARADAPWPEALVALGWERR
jgi:hypothetical protein